MLCFTTFNIKRALAVHEEAKNQREFLAETLRISIGTSNTQKWYDTLKGHQKRFEHLPDRKHITLYVGKIAATPGEILVPANYTLRQFLSLFGNKTNKARTLWKIAEEECIYRKAINLERAVTSQFGFKILHHTCSPSSLENFCKNLMQYAEKVPDTIFPFPFQVSVVSR